MEKGYLIVVKMTHGTQSAEDTAGVVMDLVSGTIELCVVNFLKINDYVLVDFEEADDDFENLWYITIREEDEPDKVWSVVAREIPVY